ncbi:hypothetical protein [Streptomyces sp. NPDC017673]|uniref:hypothetical protein n=1 Tax=unclassified Streptomyces TaxID=2593676 RepID=UPI0037A6F78C
MRARRPTATAAVDPLGADTAGGQDRAGRVQSGGHGGDGEVTAAGGEQEQQAGDRVEPPAVADMAYAGFSGPGRRNTGPAVARVTGLDTARPVISGPTRPPEGAWCRKISRGAMAAPAPKAGSGAVREGRALLACAGPAEEAGAPAP